jgi:hypothetical protein
MSKTIEWVIDKEPKFDKNGKLISPAIGHYEETHIEQLKESLKTLVKILARECPDYRDWLEVNYKEYME